MRGEREKGREIRELFSLRHPLSVYIEKFYIS